MEVDGRAAHDHHPCAEERIDGCHHPQATSHGVRVGVGHVQRVCGPIVHRSRTERSADVSSPRRSRSSSRSIGSDERRPASSNLARLALRRSTTSSIDVTTTGSTATSASVPPVAATTLCNRGEPRIDEAVLDPRQLRHTDTASGAQLLQREPSGPASLPKRGAGSYEQVIHVLYPITQTPFALETYWLQDGRSFRLEHRAWRIPPVTVG